MLATTPRAPSRRKAPTPDADRFYEVAADIFRVMAAPTRLKIISQLCEGEKNVGELLALVQTTQPNISQHLHTLFKSGIVGRRREGVQIYYFIANERVVDLCRSLCGVIAAEAKVPHP